jgi:hypothetical protein
MGLASVAGSAVSLREQQITLSRRYFPSRAALMGMYTSTSRSASQRAFRWIIRIEDTHGVDLHIRLAHRALDLALGMATMIVAAIRQDHERLPRILTRRVGGPWCLDSPR